MSNGEDTDRPGGLAADAWLGILEDGQKGLDRPAVADGAECPCRLLAYGPVGPT